MNRRRHHCCQTGISETLGWRHGKMTIPTRWPPVDTAHATGKERARMQDPGCATGNTPSSRDPPAGLDWPVSGRGSPVAAAEGASRRRRPSRWEHVPEHAPEVRPANHGRRVTEISPPSKLAHTRRRVGDESTPAAKHRRALQSTLPGTL